MTEEKIVEQCRNAYLSSQKKLNQKIERQAEDIEAYKQLIKQMKQADANTLVTLNYKLLIARQVAEELTKKQKKLEAIFNKIRAILDYEETPETVKLELIRKEIKKYATEKH